MSGQPEYNVGDVLYSLDGTGRRIVPIQVVSITSKRTVSGVEISYEVTTPARSQRGESAFNLERVVGEIYTSLPALRDFMMDNAQRAIDGMVQHAQDVALKTFALDGIPASSEEAEIELTADERSSPPPAPPGKMRVHMPDGSIEIIDADDELSV